MRKNGSRLISVKQYKTTDLVIFAVILIVAEVLSYFATVWFPSSVFFVLSLTVPVSALVVVRWGWWGIFYPVIGGVTSCLLRGTGFNYYAVYCIGGMAIALLLLPTKLIGADKIRSKWYFTAIFAVGAWLSVYLGRSLVWMVAYAISPVVGSNIYAGFVGFGLDIISLFATVVVMLIMRRLDGMFEDQKSYLKRIDKEKRDKMKYDNYGDEPVEIDEEALSILNRDNDLYD